MSEDTHAPTEATAQASTPAPPPPPAPEKPAHPAAQTRPLWIAIIALAAVLLFVIAFSLGRASGHHVGDRFGPGIARHGQMGSGPGWGY